MKEAAVPDWQWTQLSELVADRMGLHFPPARQADLQRGVAAAARELRLAEASYVQRLLASPPDAAQLQLLARHLTIGETYFFRDPQLLQALRQVLAALIAARRGRDQRLRIWSAGCASGEEAYSLAILLHEALPDLAGWGVTITATDINPDALHKAAVGVYGEWSFRNVPQAVKDRYFERRADGRHAIVPHIRKLVSFEHLNLVQDAYPTLATDTNAMDIVFCRNVLMYFTPEQARRVIARLHRALGEGGWLAVSPSETSHVLFRQFEAVNFPGAILYRKRTKLQQQAAVQVAPPQPAQLPPLAQPPQPAAPPQPRVIVQQPDTRTVAARARALANEGKLQEALPWCDRWLEADKLDAAAHYLRAVVLLEQGEYEQARASLRRATFLAPGFVLAHFALAGLARRQERSAEAARHFANTAQLLAGYQPGDLLPEGEGLSAGTLSQTLAAITDVEVAE